MAGKRREIDNLPPFSLLFLFLKSIEIFLDFIRDSVIMITLSRDGMSSESVLEQLWRSRLVGRGRMIGNHVDL